MAEFATTKIELDEEQEKALEAQVFAVISAAMPAHREREEWLATLQKAYKGEPETKEKEYPWKGCSNVVVPLVSIVVDAIVARLMKSVFAVKSPIEIEIKSKTGEWQEKDIRDWCEYFLTTSGARDKMRSVFFDLAKDGEAYIKPMWVEKSREHHGYDASGEVVATKIVDYEGPMWFSPSPSDVITPTGFDDWDSLPWWAMRLRYTAAELSRIAEVQGYENIEEVRHFAAPRRDSRNTNAQVGQRKEGEAAQADWPIELLEIWGEFEIPQAKTPSAEEKLAEKRFVETILTYSFSARKFVKKIYNPFFGRARFMKRVPYLVQAHELHGVGAAEQALPGQIEASTIHNQVIDAATAANGGITVISTNTNIGNEERVYPGKIIRDDNPDKVRILHLAEASPTLQNMQDSVIRMTETKTGVSAYHLGMESSIVGSQATATGTTALINEGNNRFWVSIDDMRDALVEVLYLTIQLVQQMKPEGVQISEDRTVKFPQSDVRTALGLKLNMASESLNRDVELQNMQVLMAVLNEYYGRLMNASAMIFNPQFPEEQKKVAIQVMTSSQDIVRRFVERFSVENIDTIVPNILTVLQGAMNGQPQPSMGQPAAGQPQSLPQDPGGGAGAMPPAPADGGQF